MISLMIVIIVIEAAIELFLRLQIDNGESVVVCFLDV